MVSDSRRCLGLWGRVSEMGRTQDWGPTSPVLKPRDCVKLCPNSLVVPALGPGLQSLGASVGRAAPSRWRYWLKARKGG